MAKRDNYLRGDVNVILNKLVQDGIIVGFSTNFDKRSTAQPEVTVVAGTAMDHKRVEDAVCRALEPVPETIIVTVKAG
jgi:hypothetical protein